jgi:hypothetical protein
MSGIEKQIKKAVGGKKSGGLPEKKVAKAVKGSLK